MQHTHRSRVASLAPYRMFGMGSLVVGICFLSGCVTREDIRGLQTDLYNIQKGLESKTENVQTSQADLLLDMRSLNSHIEALQAELKDNQDRIRSLMIRLDDLESSLKSRIDSQIELLSGSKFVDKPSPSTVFNLANTDFARGKDQEALKGFENYVKMFPSGQQVPEAKVKIGDILVKQKQESAAVEAYDVVVRDFPKSQLASTALFKKAKTLESLGKDAAATKAYEALVKSYPYSSEAKAAQDKLRENQK